MTDYERERFIKVIDEGLKRGREDADDSLRVDAFAIVVIYNETDEDGGERESTAVWADSGRNFYKRGILHQGLERLSYDDDPD
jgi:hypothetical protein